MHAPTRTPFARQTQWCLVPAATQRSCILEKCGGRESESKQKKTTRLSSDRKFFLFNGRFWDWIFGKKGSVVESGSPVGAHNWETGVSQTPKPEWGRIWNYPEVPNHIEAPENSSVLQICSPLHSTSSETSCLRWYPRCIQCLAALLFDPNLQPWCFAPSIRVLGWSSHL